MNMRASKQELTRFPSTWAPRRCLKAVGSARPSPNACAGGENYTHGRRLHRDPSTAQPR